MATKATLPATAEAAGVKTPGKGVFSDPAQVGAMIQSMYPQYANMDALTLGQRWIDVHTPQATGSGAGVADVLQAPDNSSNPYAYSGQDTQANGDLSGLGKFATPIMQNPQPQSQPQPQPQQVSLPTRINASIPLMGNVNVMGQNATPMTAPVQLQQSKPKAPTYLSSFDISKMRG